MSTKKPHRICIFCACPLGANRGKEHVIPQWLLTHLHLTEEDVFQFVASSVDLSIKQERVIPNRAFVEGHVCKKCNSGWMHQLEDTATPLLKDLIDGARTVHGLTAEERLLAAKWATKTAYVLTYPTPLNEPVDPSHLQFLQANEQTLPVGVAVFAQQHVPTGKASYFQTNTWPHLSEAVPGARDVVRSSKSSYKIALQFDRLMLLVAYWPPQGSVYAMVVGLHVPLWPITPFYLGYYNAIDVPLPYDSRSLLERFSSTLAIYHRASP